MDRRPLISHLIKGTLIYSLLFKAVQAYRLDGVVEKIACPMLTADPQDEQFWPGQSRRLYERLTCPKTLIPFTTAEGANLHGELRSPGRRDWRVFDRLDETLAKIQ